MRDRRRYFFSAITLALALSGCSWMADNEASAYLLTTYATEKVIDGDPEKAARVVEIATEVLQFADATPEATIDLLIQEIREQIRWSRLDPPDTRLVNALLIELSVRLKERYGEGIIPADARLTVRTLAGWVLEAAGTVADT